MPISSSNNLCVLKIRSVHKISDLQDPPSRGLRRVNWPMIRFLLALLSWFGAFFRSRHDLGLEPSPCGSRSASSNVRTRDPS